MPTGSVTNTFDWGRFSMLISTMNDVPGYRITKVLGECFGLTVRSRNAFSQLGAGLKSLAGGELKGMTKNLQNSREEVIVRMCDEAQSRGGNAVIAMRFDTSEMGSNWTEICAYGTAVVIEPIVAATHACSGPEFGLGQDLSVS